MTMPLLLYDSSFYSLAFIEFPFIVLCCYARRFLYFIVVHVFLRYFLSLFLVCPLCFQFYVFHVIYVFISLSFMLLIDSSVYFISFPSVSFTSWFQCLFQCCFKQTPPPPTTTTQPKIQTHCAETLQVSSTTTQHYKH
jgi:hypothetical protein